MFGFSGYHLKLWDSSDIFPNHDLKILTLIIRVVAWIMFFSISKFLVILKLLKWNP